MAISPSSSVQRARQELAERLREIRLDAGLTARALSAAADWHEAKTSRIESAKQAPGEADIQTWCQMCDLSRNTVRTRFAIACFALGVGWRQRAGRVRAAI
jgi:transcriptional regulator with XRE-family HTH domain